MTDDVGEPVGLRIRNLQVDVPPDEHAAALAWWAEALGGTPRAVEGPYHHLDGVRSRVGVHVQRLEEGPARYHLDLEADDVATEVQRLLALGAEHRGDAAAWEEDAEVLADPAGLLLCVTDVGQPQHLSDERGLAHLRVLMLDVPAPVAEETATFWAAALGGRARPVGERYPQYTWIHDVAGPGGPINIAVQATDEGPPRLHVDLHCPDPAARDAEVARLSAAGAVEVEAANHWRVLRLPGGHLACVVPDAPS